MVIRTSQGATGRIRSWALRSLGHGALVLCLWSTASHAAPGPRTLFIVIDAVPYDVVARLTDPTLGEDALFQGFKGPVPLVSSFPSTTSLALTGILEPLNLDKAPGYEARFFDWERNKRRGAGPISYHRIVFPWREFFDWRVSSLWDRAMSDLRPIKAGIREVDEALTAFLESEDPAFFAYIGTTDALAHLKGPDKLVHVLRALDEGIRRIRRGHPEEVFYVVLFSDHGMAGGKPLKNVRKDVRLAVKAAGFRPSGRIRRPDDVVFTPFGLVSSFEIYTAPGQEERAAQALVTAEGVDLCVFPGGGGWIVESRRGRAEIHRRETAWENLWSYRPVTGDPLEYEAVLARLRKRSAAGEQEWFPASWWFHATEDHVYPGGLHRLVESFDLVQNPASVACSLLPGYMFGARKTELAARLSIGRLRWTHGALYREASLGFLLSDVPGWIPPDSLLYHQALLPFVGLGEAQMAGAGVPAGSDSKP